MRRRTFFPVSLAGLAACSSPSRPLIDVRMGVGGAAQIVYLPTTLAERLGLFEKEGLRVTLEDFPGGSKALQALLGGSVDVVSGFYDHTIQMAAEGKPLRAFVNLLRYPGLTLVVSPRTTRRIERIDDLAGATVGVTAPGSSTHFFLNYLLAKRNIELTGVSVVGVGHTATALAAVESGKVDAAILTEPGLAMLQQREPKLRLLADTRTREGVETLFGAPQFPASVLYAKQDWLNRNKDTAARLTRAMRSTLIWMLSHTAGQIADKMPAEHVGPDRRLYEEALIAAMPVFNPDGAIRPEGAEAVRRVLSYSVPAVREAQIDLAGTFTNEFVEADLGR